MRKVFLMVLLLSFIFIITGIFLKETSPAVAEKEIIFGIIDGKKVMEEWPKFKSYSLQMEAQRITYAVLFQKASPNMTDAEKEEMQYQISKILEHSNTILMQALTNEMEEAAKKIAIEKKMNMVFFKDSVHFGGTDITDDVLKFLK